MRDISISLAAFPGLRHEEAAAAAHQLVNRGELNEPLFGAVGAKHVQLVPQNRGWIDESLAQHLRDTYPLTQFRLHANVRVQPSLRVVDLAGFQTQREWFSDAARIGRLLRAPAYTAHAGRRAQATFRELLDNVRRAAELFGCPVGVEGHYPTRNDEYLLSSWEEYRQLFAAKVPYVIDLSHMNIIARASGRYEIGLLKEMLSCENCLEVHLSDNDGRADTHDVCTKPTWWFPLLPNIHGNAVVFTEGNHRKKEKMYANH